jgi:hypothetical protein
MLRLTGHRGRIAARAIARTGDAGRFTRIGYSISASQRAFSTAWMRRYTSSFS